MRGLLKVLFSFERLALFLLDLARKAAATTKHRRHFFALIGEALDSASQLGVDGRDDIGDAAAAASARGTADAVQMLRHVGRKVELHDVVNVSEIEPARAKIGTDERANGGILAKPLHICNARVARYILVQSDHAAQAKDVRQSALRAQCHVHRVDKHQHLACVVRRALGHELVHEAPLLFLGIHKMPRRLQLRVRLVQQRRAHRHVLRVPAVNEIDHTLHFGLVAHPVRKCRAHKHYHPPPRMRQLL
mmetsp:Transcript_12606/g.33957  ORF Transcript_12606/g.33957 Transcript_12606/m.33957 type:complete len:248 (-) Transcript_12606:1138-1881(-)